MVAVSYPGVYVEEIPSGAKVIQAAGTSTAAFFGVAEKGPIGRMVKIFSFAEYVSNFGGYLSGYFLAHSVYQFFNNGGTQCYIGRVAPGAQTGSVTLLDQFPSTPAASLNITASSSGDWSKNYVFTIDAPADSNFFDIKVYPEPPTGGSLASTPLETLAGLSMNPASLQFVETVLKRDSAYLLATVNTGNTHVVNGSSTSGAIQVTDSSGGTPVAVDILGPYQREFQINICGDGLQLIDITDSLANSSVVTTAVAANQSCQSLSDIGKAIKDAISKKLPIHDSTLANVYAVDVQVVTITGDTDHNKLKIIAGGVASDNSKVEVSMSPNSDKDIASVLQLGANRGLELYGSYQKRPQAVTGGSYISLGDAAVSGAVSASTVATNGNLPPADSDYSAAFTWLDAIPDVSLISVPGVGSPALFDAGMNYCKTTRPLSDCFYIGELTEHEDELTDITNPSGPPGFVEQIMNPNSYGAVYFPWLKMADPTGASTTPIAVPPSGFIAGLYARIDSSRGVWKAAAGTEATLAGTVGLVTNLTDVQQGNVNNLSKSVCVIRNFPSSGIVSWGARTVSNDPEYKYIPIRRTAIMLRKSIYDGIQWAVFEPNDHRLWAALKLNIESFMNGLFRAGAFQGSKASDAYFVRCGLGDTMTQEDIDLGKVIVKVGFAPLKPAEFVIVTIEQIVGQ